MTWAWPHGQLLGSSLLRREAMVAFSLWQKAPRGKLASLEDYSLNKLDTSTEGNTFFRDPQALSSTLAALGMLQPRAFRSLNNVYPSVSSCYYYLLND